MLSNYNVAVNKEYRNYQMNQKIYGSCLNVGSAKWVFTKDVLEKTISVHKFQFDLIYFHYTLKFYHFL